jgi:hypothetical protein
MPVSTTLEPPVTAQVAVALDEQLALDGDITRENDTSETIDTANSVVYVVQSTYNHRTPDNLRVSDQDLVANEGWFADVESARIRCGQLNARNHAYYDACMDTKKRERAALIHDATQTNLEAAAIRSAGMLKSDVAIPLAFVPETFEKFFSKSNHTTYEPIAIRRSDHDGIARAAAV